MTENIKPRLLIMYDYFYPAYKAGGPIQSLTNLVYSLQDDLDIFVLTGAYDLNSDQLPDVVKINGWCDVKLPGSTARVKVWYAGRGGPGAGTIKRIIEDVKPCAVYLNGMFSYKFVLIPLLTIKNARIILCPRGMLQMGALAGKSFKKRLFLSVLKTSGILTKAAWHATNPDEQADIIREFGKNSAIFIAGNIPKKPVENLHYINKNRNELRLVYLSLITEKKNLLQLINIVAGMEENISLDIYGPVKDQAYWKTCLRIINDSGGKVKYKGDVQPDMVQETFARYHSSVLLTKGENFGHALYESLSVGRPVITSYFTAWNQLEDKKAGWNVDISADHEIAKVFTEVYNLDQPAYDLYCVGAYGLANEYYLHGFDMLSYKKMFIK